ncbi:MAG: DUF1467 family protein [Sphingomonadales bacterium]
MGIITGLLVYVLTWWMIWFMILPIGVKTQEEKGEGIPGTPKSAPVNPLILKKMAATSVVAALVWGVIFYLIETA